MTVDFAPALTDQFILVSSQSTGILPLFISILSIVSHDEKHSCFPGGIPIRGPVLSKVVFVASFMVPQYVNGSLPLAYTVFYFSLDTLIAGCTFIIWYCETDNPSSMQLAKNMMKLALSGLPRRKSSVVVVFCGGIQVSGR